ncbi:hypothetical protein ACFC0N_20300 [Streptomyces zaomyceticus]|uniref:hypothetical protein n=1 Tax=Streptomyces zaomyceticus TaxID=68286 RepID=UPI0035D8E18B
MNTGAHSTSPRRRGIAVALAATLSGTAVLTGCDADADADADAGTGAGGTPASARPAPVSDSASAASVAPAVEAFDPAEVLAAAGKKPSAANARTISEPCRAASAWRRSPR